MRKVSCNWIANAEKDLKWAERMLEEGDYDYSAFHSQQAAEKALKALIIAQGKHPPRTHDIEVLLNTLRSSGLDVRLLDRLGAEELTKYAVEARYPDFEETVTEGEAEKALHLAETVLRWAKEKLEEMGIEC